MFFVVNQADTDASGVRFPVVFQRLHWSGAFQYLNISSACIESAFRAFFIKVDPVQPETSPMSVPAKEGIKRLGLTARRSRRVRDSRRSEVLREKQPAFVPLRKSPVTIEIRAKLAQKITKATVLPLRHSRARKSDRGPVISMQTSGNHQCAASSGRTHVRDWPNARNWARKIPCRRSVRPRNCRINGTLLNS